MDDSSDLPEIIVSDSELEHFNANMVCTHPQNKIYFI
jgi:hypothetical protein